MDWLVVLVGAVLIIGSIAGAWMADKKYLPPIFGPLAERSVYWLVSLLIAVLFFGALGIAKCFNPDEIPKVVGAGFGAAVSAGIAFLISALARVNAGAKMHRPAGVKVRHG